MRYRPTNIRKCSKNIQKTKKCTKKLAICMKMMFNKLEKYSKNKKMHKKTCNLYENDV